MDVKERNKLVVEMVEDFFKRAGEGKLPPINREDREDIERIFGTTATGFREIVLVITIARLLNSEFRASNKFYECKPRALYEGPIRSVLRKQNIPHAKSGPLNVAKAVAGINLEWAAQRGEVAQAVVRLVRRIEGMSKQDLTNFALALHDKFLREAARVSALATEIPAESDPAYLLRVCKELIDNVPDAGNTPQRIVGLILLSYHQGLETGLNISGWEDRASVTSTTSKKPGDIQVEDDTGEVVLVYEITVKPFGEARVEESWDTLRAYAKTYQSEISEVMVICREQDCHPDIKRTANSKTHFGSLDYKGAKYHFVDIYEWIIAQLVNMPSDSRLFFYRKLHEYVLDSNTAEKVKLFWKNLHDKNP